MPSGKRCSSAPTICRHLTDDRALAEQAVSDVAQKKFKAYPIGFFHIDIAEVQTAEAKLYLFVAIDRTSPVQLVHKANRVTASAFHSAMALASAPQANRQSGLAVSAVNGCRRCRCGRRPLLTRYSPSI
jgi:hypothetical protein